MLATGIAGGVGTFSNIGAAYGKGTALGAVSAGEGATAVLALVLLGLTMLGQSSPRIVRAGLWALPAAASAMAAMAAPDVGRTVIYAVTPMGMTVAAEGMAFLARRIVVHQDGRDAEAEARAAGVVRELAYQRAVAANHPDKKVKKKAEREAWKLARQVGMGDVELSARLLHVQRERVIVGADAALEAMFVAPAPEAPALPTGPTQMAAPALPPVDADWEETEVPTANRSVPELGEPARAGEARPMPTPADGNPFWEPGDSTPVQAAGPAPRAVAAESARPRRATGRVPQSARRPARPKRTAAELLTEARKATADWPEGQLTADRIRAAVHTSSQRARELRETLRDERIGRAAEQRHQFEEPPEVEAAFARLAPGTPARREALGVAA
ncbi:conjugal transfer protein [Streptomyces sp. NPDC048172]|uniref:conjugal transfer protein n=1 Tax=Streptomyces sp. NPDC048172 TaxID=3365505 RepID=UPI00371D4563